MNEAAMYFAIAFIGLVLVLAAEKLKPVPKCAACQSRLHRGATTCHRCGRSSAAAEESLGGQP